MEAYSASWWGLWTWYQGLHQHGKEGNPFTWKMWICFGGWRFGRTSWIQWYQGMWNLEANVFVWTRFCLHHIVVTLFFFSIPLCACTFATSIDWFAHRDYYWNILHSILLWIHFGSPKKDVCQGRTIAPLYHGIEWYQSANIPSVER